MPWCADKQQGRVNRTPSATLRDAGVTYGLTQLSPSHAFSKQFQKVQTPLSSARTHCIPKNVRNPPYLTDFSPYCGYTDAVLTEWGLKWRQNGWKNATGNPVPNKLLIEYILTLLETRQRSGQPVKIEYDKGHFGDIGNDGADTLAIAGCNLPEEQERDWDKLNKDLQAREGLGDTFDDGR